MSADNGIYIGQFRDGFRVIHAQAIENINYYPKNSRGCLQTIKDYFEDSKVFKTELEALEFAYEMAKHIPVLEYGICSLGKLPLWRIK